MYAAWMRTIRYRVVIELRRVKGNEELIRENKKNRDQTAHGSGLNRTGEVHLHCKLRIYYAAWMRTFRYPVVIKCKVLFNAKLVRGKGNGEMVPPIKNNRTSKPIHDSDLSRIGEMRTIRYRVGIECKCQVSAVVGFQPHFKVKVKDRIILSRANIESRSSKLVIWAATEERRREQEQELGRPKKKKKENCLKSYD
ncbi:hypothetical protein B0H16DRAFT_1477289 [Mycena metata]|uniref:Uncharacterized protein n=1 Tax=Mycena metata TaxID=1033252 RepID=A0AAD7H9Y8_9AGAR|nr:hypothetical protein B0H16DRAFT_1477289 [Mycena metata]